MDLGMHCRGDTTQLCFWPDLQSSVNSSIIPSLAGQPLCEGVVPQDYHNTRILGKIGSSLVACLFQLPSYRVLHNPCNR